MSDEERRRIAERLRGLRRDANNVTQLNHGPTWSLAWCVLGDGLDECGTGDWFERMCARLADLIDPPYPDATASYRGWRVQVYDPEGKLVSPSNLAADLVQAHADGKMRHSTKEEQNEYRAMLEKMSVELHPVDREALLALADEMDEVAQRRRSMGYEGFAIGDEDRASRIREALGVGK